MVARAWSDFEWSYLIGVGVGPSSRDWGWAVHLLVHVKKNFAPLEHEVQVYATALNFNFELLQLSVHLVLDGPQEDWSSSS